MIKLGAPHTSPCLRKDGGLFTLTFQLSGFGRETDDFRIHLMVSRFSLENSRLCTMDYNLSQNVITSLKST